MNCPPRHVLLALPDDTGLPPERVAAILDHADRCANCTKVLQDASNLTPSLAVLIDERRDRDSKPDFKMRTGTAPALAVRAGSPWWVRVALVVAAAAVGLAVALGTKVGRQAAELRESAATVARADETTRKAAAEVKLADAHAALALGLAAIEDGDPRGTDDVTAVADAARALAADPDLDASSKAAAAALARRAEANRDGWTFARGPAHPGYRPRLAVLTPTLDLLLTVASDARVVVWDAKTGKPLAACVPDGNPGGRFEALAVSGEAEYVAAAGTDGRVWVWNLPRTGVATPAHPPVDVGGGRPVWVLAFGKKDGRSAMPDLLAVGSDGVPLKRRLVVENIPPVGSAPPTDLDREPGPGPRVGPIRRARPVVAAGAEPGGRQAFTADPEAGFRYWDVPTRTPLGPASHTFGPPPR